MKIYPTLRKLSADQVRELRRKREAGETLERLGLHFGLNSKSVYQILCGKTYKEIE
jgi:hypothetical protein